jgi:nucleotide-binding universal stress UspA family protein
MADSPILICYDGSAASDRAIEVAAKLLGTDRRAVVLNIGSEITAAESLATVSPLVTGAAFEELNTDDAMQRAQAGTERALKAGYMATPRAELSAPTWEGITDVADELDAAVIVMGSRGLHGAREALDGSVSHDVATHAARPVLIVPPLR